MPLPEDSNLYGSSVLHEAGTDDLRSIFDKPSSTAIPLGHNKGDASTGIAFDFARGGDPGHLVTLGTTRSGKLVSVIAPALLTIENSAVVLDPKLEAAWLTADYRRSIGHRVVILDAWNQVNELYGSQVGVTEVVTSFNPLSSLNADDSDFNDDVSAISLALTLLGPNPDHWSKSGKILISGLIAAAVELHGACASLRYVIDTITSDDKALLDEIEKVIANRPNGVAARKLRRFKPRESKDGQLIVSKEIASIRSTAETQLELLYSETLMRSMESDNPPFKMEELATGKVTLYIGLPVNRLESHGRWMRMILTLVIRAISSAKRRPALPVVMILDELGTISPGYGLTMVEQSVGLMAGMGIRIWAILQDLTQLKRDYPDSWETFISNASMVQVLNCADSTTSEYISSYLGTKTINSKTGEWSYKQVQWANPQEWTDEVNRRVAESMGRLIAHHREIYGHAWDVYETLTRGLEPSPIYSQPPIVPTPAHWPKPHPSTFRDPSMPNTDRTIHPPKENREPSPEQLAGWDKTVRAEVETAFGAEIHSTSEYRMEWVPDEHLAQRAVLLPTEVRESPEDQSIIIMPRRGKNYRLPRFEYYSDPVLSTRARHDPNQPKPVIKPWIVPAASIAETVSYDTQAAPFVASPPTAPPAPVPAPIASPAPVLTPTAPPAARRPGIDLETIPLNPTAYAAACEITDANRAWFNRENKIAVLERRYGVTLKQASDALTRHFRNKNGSIF